MTTLARLHAALDSVVEAEVLIAEITASTAGPPGLARAAQLVHDAREALRSMLRSKTRQAGVGEPASP